MLKKILTLALLICICKFSNAQNINAEKWVDSVFKTLTPDEQIAQLMVVRLSTINSATKTVTFFDKEVADLTGYELVKVKSYIQNGKRNLKICIEKNSEQ